LEAVVDGGANEFVAGFADVKLKPKVAAAAAFAGVVAAKLKSGFAGESAVALPLGAPKRPPRGDFDALGEVRFTEGG